MATLASGAERLRIVTLAPGHFHAALIQKESLPELSEEAFVYAPLGTDLSAHLNRIAGFNFRKDNPTNWKLRVYAGADYWERMLADRPGDVVVLSGANRGKIDRIEQIAAGKMHALADKPWIIDSADLPKLEAALKTAAANNVVAYDGMTQRFEISCILQRALVSDADVFGKPLPGSVEEPSVYMESVHYLLKLVAGAPNLRPAWFFDIRQQGEGLADVGTHLVDLVQWILFPDQGIEYRKDIRVLRGSRWPTVISAPDFQRVTGERQFPEYLKDAVRPDGLHYYCNNSVTYAIKGVHTKLDVKWGYEAAPGQGDTELAVFRGSRSRVEARQGKPENFRPEVYVVPRPELKAAVLASIRQRLAAMSAEWPGLGVEDQGERIRVTIPDRHRIGHEAHFALLVGRFLQYVKKPSAIPAWETPAMVSKYYVTTKGVELALKDTR
ncbi:MAG TPA: putative oxidoreductase C-terminal domain-containing protein [Bryobacteraceae bacterium]|nr:putative oxidoreductase C-terminal domain-containing protein [Bryobacteraceae bacterium]